MSDFGIVCNEKNIYTTIDLTIEYIIDNNIKNIYVVGTKSFINELANYTNVITTYDHQKNIDLVVVGYDTELTYDKLIIASKYLLDGVKFISTNIDFRCPISSNYFVPDCGLITKMLEKTTNRKSIYLGKPNPNLYNLIIKRNSLNIDECMCVGDRLYTDILGGKKAKIFTTLVLSGETNFKDLENSKVKPDYVLRSINELKKVLD